MSLNNRSLSQKKIEKIKELKDQISELKKFPILYFKEINAPLF